MKIILIVVAVAATIVLLATRLSGLLCVIVLSVMLAYILNKPLKLLEKRMKRLWALLMVFGALVAVAAFFCLVIIPLILRQAADFMAYLPKMLQFLSDLLSSAGNRFGEPVDGIINHTYDNFNTRLADWLGSTTVSVAHVSYSWLGWAVLLPFLTFYLLKDHTYFIGQIGYLIPIKYRSDLNLLYQAIDKALTQFFRGQLLAALVVASLDFVGFAIIGVPNFLLLALLCGLCNLIPYVGPFIGAVPVALVSAVQGWRLMLLALLIVFLVQQVDNMVVSPRIIGGSLRIHPIYIILAIIIGSSVFHVMGLVFALPGLIVIREVVLHVFRKRLYREPNPQ